VVAHAKQLECSICPEILLRDGCYLAWNLCDVNISILVDYIVWYYEIELGSEIA